MSKSSLYVLWALILFLIPGILTGQKSPQLSKPDSDKNISDSLTLVEKVYLHTDRTFYFPGDDIWFKAYLIDASERLLTNHSNNLHVELISPASKIIESRVIKINGGLGNGDFKLPDSIDAGKYRIRGYTNYMRNFTDQLFFNKEIVVINSNGKTDPVSGEVKYVENKIQLSFFPEGGSLVDNASSLIAFKAVNNLGKGCDVTGKIYSSNNDLITTFKSSHLGMGSFFLRPLPGLKYYSIYKGSDSVEFKTELPKSFPDGVTFSASQNQDNKLIISIKCNPQNFNAEHDLLLRFSLRNKEIKSVKCKVNAQVAHFTIPVNDLPDGIVMITLLAANYNPLAERLLYISNKAPVSIQIEPDKLTYEKREPVSLKISMPGDSITDYDANISLAAVNKNLTDNTSLFPRNISSWFLLESDVHGAVEDPSYYFDPSNSQRFRDLDLLLLTQGWRDFAWKYNTYFAPENGFAFSGRLRRNYVNKPIEASRVSIGVFGVKGQLVTIVPVDSSGRFKLSNIDFAGQARLIVTGIGKKGRLQGKLFIDSAIYTPPKVPENLSPVNFVIENKLTSLKTYYEINSSIRKKYKLSDTVKLGEVKIISELKKDPQTIQVERSRRVYDQPDSEVKITEQMQSYPFLIDVLRGRVPGLVVEGSFPNYNIVIRGLSSISAQGLPLVLVNGMSSSFEDLEFIPIPMVDRIDVLKTAASTSIFGLRGSNGVINIITRAEGMAYVPVEYSHNVKINGYNASRIFYSPQHSADSNSEYEPDLRSTLLWEPDINIDNYKDVTLKYYNADNSSVITVIAEGITSTGIPVTGKAEYEVK